MTKENKAKLKKTLMWIMMLTDALNASFFEVNFEKEVAVDGG